MRHRMCWLSGLVALLAASSLIAQPGPALFGGPPPPSAGTLVLLDDKGNEVLRLAPDQATTGLKALPAGDYLLKVEAPGAFHLVVGQPTQVEVNRELATPPAAAKPAGPASPVVIDFDLAPGDQGQRQTQVPGPGAQVSLQLTGLGLPPIYGWSAVLEYDPGQLRLVDGSFTPSAFIPGLVPLVDAKTGRVEVGGANFSKTVAKGDGDLASLSFETLEGFRGETAVKMVGINLRKRDGGEALQVEVPALILGGPPGPPAGTQPQGGRPPMAGPEAVTQLIQTKSCPGCDLSGAQLMSPTGAPVDLSGADLTGANLKDANLYFVNLARGKLAGAILVNANLMKADLTSADLSNADLTGTRLQNARLRDANLTGARNLGGALLKGTDLTNAIWVDGGRCGPNSIDRCVR